MCLSSTCNGSDCLVGCLCVSLPRVMEATALWDVCFSSTCNGSYCLVGCLCVSLPRVMEATALWDVCVFLFHV